MKVTPSFGSIDAIITYERQQGMQSANWPHRATSHSTPRNVWANAVSNRASGSAVAAYITFTMTCTPA